MHAQIRAEQARDSYVSGTESMEGNIRLVLRRPTRISMQNWIVGKELEVQEKVAGRGEAKGGKKGVLFVSGLSALGRKLCPNCVTCRLLSRREGYFSSPFI